MLNHYSERLDKLDIALVAIVLLLSSLSVAGLLLAQFGVFNMLLLLLACTSIIVIGVASVGWRARDVLVRYLTATQLTQALSLSLLLLAATFLFAHPAEYVVGGGDAGVYVNWAVDIARTGSILPRDPITADLPLEQLDGFLRRQPPTVETDFIRFPGFYLSETDQSVLIPQFFPLQAVWMAIAYPIAGVDGVLLTTPLWGVLGVFAFFLLARLFLPWPMALLAAALLAVNPLQIYFSRYPTAEALTQFLIWAGLWSFTCYISHRPLRPLWGVTAALALGLVSLARIDALPLFGLPAAWALYLTIFRKWRRNEIWFWLVYLLLTGYAVFYALVYAYPYTYNTYASVLSTLWRLGPPVLLVAALFAGAALLVRFGLRQRTHQQSAWTIERFARLAGAVLVVLLILYAYFVRPMLGNISVQNYWYAQTQVPFSNHENLVRLGWYLTPIGIGLAAAGFCVLSLRGRWRMLWPWVLVGGAFAVLYLYNILNNPIQIYAMRRYVPVVLPTFILAAVFALAWLWHRKQRTILWRSVAMSFLAIWLVGLAYSGRLIWTHVEYAGIREQIEALANQFPEDALLLFADPAPVGLGVVLGTPLHFMYDLPSYDLQEETLTQAGLLAQIRDWQENGFTLYLLVTDGAEIPLDASYLTPVAPVQVTYPFLEQSYERAPTFIRQVDLKLDVYAIETSFP